MDSPLTLGVITTHPIQYQAPLFRELSRREGLDVIVFFHQLPDPKKQGEGFGTAFTWDLPLLEGYTWKVLASGDSDREGAPTFASFGEAYRAVDVMVIHGWQSPYMWRAWARGLFASTPLLVRGESNAMRTRPLPVQMLHHWYLKPFQRYLYIGESNKQFYREAGVDEEALVPARYCIENERFDSDWHALKPRRRTIREQFGIDEDATCFVFCGKFIDKKRPGDAVTAFLRALSHTDAAAHLLMVGDGELRTTVEAKVPDDAPVTFTGFLNQTEIGEAYTAADVMVLPSDYGETWGLVLNEGMIFEMSALVSDRVGSTPDLITEGKTGYTFPFGDIDALAKQMVQMAEHPENVQLMGQNARNRILTTYTIQRAADGIEQAAHDVCKTHK